MRLNEEWLSPDFLDPQFCILLVILFLVLAAPRSMRSLTPFERIAFAVFLVLSLRSLRYFPFLAFVAVAPTVAALQGYFDFFLTRWSSFRPVGAFLDPATPDRLPDGSATIGFSFGLLLFVAVLGVLPGWPKGGLTLEQKISAQGLDILRSLPPDSKIYHTPNWGGFITWSLWPTQRAWIDDRNELNGQEAYEDFLEIVRLGPEWRERLAKYNFEYLLLESDSPLHRVVRNDPGWRPLFLGQSEGIYQRVASVVR
ncbi:MAG: hypothetical protein EBZ48_04475 [Proteobacteria bacterium]|nr:hypothetical protein [Pseudomonadota bacterium]